MSNGESIELAPLRLEQITQILLDRRIVRVNELCRETGASPATIRRDLVELERRRVLQRVHGGAVAAGNRLEEPVFEDKAVRAAAEKRHIAEAAARFVEPDDCVFLDGGSTVLALALLLRDMRHVTIVTNSLTVASALSGSGPRLILAGGELRRRSQTFVGPLSAPVLEQLHVDKAFMGTIGLTLNEGLTTTDPREAYTKKLVIQRSGRVLLLADSSKIGKVSFVRFAALDELDVLITDPAIPAEDLKVFKKTVTEVIVSENV